MDLTGSLVDTKLRIYPNNKLIDFLKTIPEENDLPENINSILGKKTKQTKEVKTNKVQLTVRDFENLNKINKFVKSKTKPKNGEDRLQNGVKESTEKAVENDLPDKESKEEDVKKETESKNDTTKYLTTSDIEWLYDYLQKHRNDPKIPYLHELLEGTNLVVPENEVIKRNPVLEARCVKLRAQQEAREYRKMTKTVDNVRIRYPEDSISYQIKQLNRQLIAIGQFIISIFAGFMFGFRGVELMIGNLDFGFRLLLGVMCALIIALAEIYFLAKKLNEELNIPETVQLGGPTKFVQSNEPNYVQNVTNDANEKEHQD